MLEDNQLSNTQTQTQLQTNNNVTNLPPGIIRPPDPVLRLRYIEPYQLKIFRKGASDSRRFTIGLALLSAAAGFLGSMVTTKYLSQAFWIYSCLLFLCVGGGSALLYVARQDKNEVLETVEEIERQLPEPPPAGTQITQ